MFARALLWGFRSHVIMPTRRVKAMSEKNSGPEEAIKGVVEGVKGKAKEVAGAVAGRDDLYR